MNPLFDLPENCYRVSVKALVQDAEGRYLLIKEGDEDDWDIPGGGIMHGEALLDALDREVQEEIGVGIKRAAFRNHGMFQASNGIWALWLLFDCELVSDQWKLGDASDLKWTALSELSNTSHIKKLLANS